LNGQVEEVVEDAGAVSASGGAVFAADDVSDPADCFAVVGADSLRPVGQREGLGGHVREGVSFLSRRVSAHLEARGG